MLYPKQVKQEKALFRHTGIATKIRCFFRISIKFWSLQINEYDLFVKKKIHTLEVDLWYLNTKLRSKWIKIFIIRHFLKLVLDFNFAQISPILFSFEQIWCFPSWEYYFNLKMQKCFSILQNFCLKLEGKWGNPGETLQQYRLQYWLSTISGSTSFLKAHEMIQTKTTFSFSSL